MKCCANVSGIKTKLLKTDALSSFFCLHCTVAGAYCAHFHLFVVTLVKMNALNVL